MDHDLKVEVTKLVSFVLRHDPLGLVMDDEGCVDLDALVSRATSQTTFGGLDVYSCLLNTQRWLVALFLMSSCWKSAPFVF